jgi:hypothetical protein
MFVLHLIHEPEGRNRIHVFLEADRSTMSLKRFLTKMRGYWHYRQSGRQTERFAVRNFLILTVAPTTQRAGNLCQVTGQIDAPKHRGLRMFLFGSEQEWSLKEPRRILDPIWKTAGDDGRHSLVE